MSRSVKVGVLVSVAMVVALAVAMGRGRTLRATRALRTLPSSTRFVMRIDVRALPSAPAARALLGGLVPTDSLSEVESVCGFDPLRDLSEITLWVRGTHQLESFGLMLTGASVDASVIAECHRSLVTSRGGDVLRLDAPTGPLMASDDRRSAVAIVDERTVLTGSVETVAEAMAVRRGLLPALDERASIAGLWRDTSPGSAVTAVAEPPDYWKSALTRTGTLGEAARFMDDVEVLGFAIGGGARNVAELRGRTFTPAGAEVVARAAAEWVASPPSTMEDPWDAVLRTGEVARDGRDIVLRVDVSSLAEPR